MRPNHRPTRKITWLVASLLCGCSAAVTPDATGGSPATIGAPADSAAGPPAPAAPSGAALATDGTKNGDETDVDCGGSSGKKCADAKACAIADDCASGVCRAGTCAAPAPDDGVANGDETDVDCGGSTGKTCASGKKCKVHADCAIDACLDGACAYGKSCRSHYGGRTCGAGEPGAAGAVHEDCCTAIDVPRPAAQGGPYRLDKYLVTAGRMRAFLTAVNNDVKSFVTASPPPGWTATWTASVPGNEVDVAMQLGAGQQGATSYGSSLGPGCWVSGQGAPAYWLPPDQQSQYNGDAARTLTRDQLDTKALNCATRALFAAFCHWDGGGRLPTYEEWKYAANGGDAARTYPWGMTLPIGNYASYNKNYAWPSMPGPNDDHGGLVPAPGRFPQGKGPFGHMDLAGALENFTSSTDGGVMQYSFQEAGKEQFNITYGTHRTWGPSTKHWAIGARCAR